MERIGGCHIIRDTMKSAYLGAASLVLVNLSAAFGGVSLGFGWLPIGTAMALGPMGVFGLLLLNILWIA